MKPKSFICTLLAALTLTLPFVSGCSEKESPKSESSAETSISAHSDAPSLTEGSDSTESQSPQSSSPESAPPEISQPAESSSETSKSDSGGITPAVWKAENSEGNYIYMMGTIHAANDDAKYMPDYVEQAYNYSDTLAFEVDVSDIMHDASKMVELVYKMMYLDGTTIKDHLSEETYNGLVSLLNENNLYSPLYDYYVPYFWESLLSNLVLQKTGLNSEQGIDMTFIDRAKKDGKGIYEIESLDFQMDMLSGFSDGVNEMMLKEYLGPNAIETQVQSTKMLYEHWKKGTIDTMLLMAETFGNKSEPDEETAKYAEEYNKIMLTDRNVVMAQKAESYIDNGEKVFVLVGAMHFYGDDGILKLMTKDGYKVSLVK